MAVVAGKKAKRRSAAQTSPRRDDAFEIAFFKGDGLRGSPSQIPAQDFLNDVCPEKVRATMRSVLIAVAAAPPHRFAGGGYWEAMHDDMSGIFEVRVDGPNRTHYRLFCVMDREALGRQGPLLVVLTGLAKPFLTKFKKSQYTGVKSLRDEYFGKNPRPLA